MKHITGHNMLNDKEKRIWHILANDWSIPALADHHAVSDQTIRNIKMLKTKQALTVWGIMEEIDVPTYTMVPTRRLTEKEVREIRTTSTSSVVLAKRYGVSPSTIRMARARLTYKELP